MPRDLADVLHYFLPELEKDPESDDATDARSGRERSAEYTRTGEGLAPSQQALRRSTPREAPLRTNPIRPADPPKPSFQVIGIPIGDRDVLRAALTWNLAVETARRGNRAIVLAPESDRQTPLWPESGSGPLGTEVAFCAAHDLDELGAAAERIARREGVLNRDETGALFVRVPTRWLTPRSCPSPLVTWWLLLSSSNPRDLSEAYELATAIRGSDSTARIGVTIHGVSNIGEARRAFEYLSRRCATQLGFDLVSYGLLVDDLHVYRAIAAQRPIGLAHPQAPATIALMDVARLISENASRADHG